MNGNHLRVRAAKVTDQEAGLLMGLDSGLERTEDHTTVGASGLTPEDT